MFLLKTVIMSNRDVDNKLWKYWLEKDTLQAHAPAQFWRYARRSGTNSEYTHDDINTEPHTSGMPFLLRDL